MASTRHSDAVSVAIVASNKKDDGVTAVYTATVELSFSAVHRVRLPDGTTEPLHGHDWIVRASFARNEVDATGMVIDFQDAKVALNSILRDLHHTNLNDHEGLAGRNPTAEVIARYVFERLVEMGLPSASRVEVAEAPGCVAAFSRTRHGADAE